MGGVAREAQVGGQGAQRRNCSIRGGGAARGGAATLHADPVRVGGCRGALARKPSRCEVSRMRASRKRQSQSWNGRYVIPSV